MRAYMYEGIFEVTETLQNGKERRLKKKVLSPIFRNSKHIPEDERIGLGFLALKNAGYYAIEYIGTKKTEVIITE